MDVYDDNDHELWNPKLDSIQWKKKKDRTGSEKSVKRSSGKMVVSGV